jgi:signal transduction histidine kinase
MAILGDEMERIFADASVSAAGSRGDAGDVPGFGLAVSKRVVEKLGGRIWAQSIEGTGTVFTFTLPVGAVQETDTDRGYSDAQLD